MISLPPDSRSIIPTRPITHIKPMLQRQLLYHGRQMIVFRLHLHLGRHSMAAYFADINAIHSATSIAMPIRMSKIAALSRHGFGFRRTAINTLDPAIMQCVVNGTSPIWIRMQHLQDTSPLRIRMQTREHRSALREVDLIDRSVFEPDQKCIPALAEHSVVEFVLIGALPGIAVVHQRHEEDAAGPNI